MADSLARASGWNRTRWKSWSAPDDAAKLWDLAEDAKALVKSLIARHRIDCDLKPGIAHMCFSEAETAAEHAYADHLATRYGYGELQKLDRDAAQAICPSPRYVGGSLDMSAAHLHPLNYALGLARAARDAGVRIHENTLVSQVHKGSPARVQAGHGAVSADHVIFACNGYLGGLEPKVAARVMPINNFIAATEPLGDEAARVLTRDIAVADSKFVVNYFRLSSDKRLLFGGGESYGYRFPRDIGATVRKPMAQIFPHLADVRFDYTWGGTLGITMKRMPYLTRPRAQHAVGLGLFRSRCRQRHPCGQADGRRDPRSGRRFRHDGARARTWLSGRQRAAFAASGAGDDMVRHARPLGRLNAPRATHRVVSASCSARTAHDFRHRMQRRAFSHWTLIFTYISIVCLVSHRSRHPPHAPITDFTRGPAHGPPHRSVFQSCFAPCPSPHSL